MLFTLRVLLSVYSEKTLCFVSQILTSCASSEECLYCSPNKKSILTHALDININQRDNKIKSKNNFIWFCIQKLCDRVSIVKCFSCQYKSYNLAEHGIWQHYLYLLLIMDVSKKNPKSCQVKQTQRCIGPDHQIWLPILYELDQIALFSLFYQVH